MQQQLSACCIAKYKSEINENDLQTKPKHLYNASQLLNNGFDEIKRCQNFGEKTLLKKIDKYA